MLGDGTNSYSWNARDQLSAVTKSGQTLPSFTYDAFGRRQSKTLGASVTSYLYDGANTVQELVGATPSANLLTGLGVDEVFQRSETAATRTLLSDALGSTLALADATGVQTSYTYAPYGATTFTGSASNNTSQFTGRENDSDGLYYYRARYYHPTFSRFVSEDPIGFGGGDSNLYAYTGNSPTNFTDPTGSCQPFAARCLPLLGGPLFGGRIGRVERRADLVDRGKALLKIAQRLGTHDLPTRRFAHWLPATPHFGNQLGCFERPPDFIDK